MSICNPPRGPVPQRDQGDASRRGGADLDADRTWPVANVPPATCLSVGTLAIDLDAGVASRAGRVLKLWPKQFALLVYLARHANQVVSRRAIAEDVWGDAMAMWTNVIAVNINGLRKEIEREGLPELLHTVRGQGYMIGDSPG